MGIIYNVVLKNMEGYNLQTEKIGEDGKVVLDEDNMPELADMTTRDLMRNLARQMPRDYTTHNDDECFIVLHELMAGDPKAEQWDLLDRHWIQLFGDDDEKKGIVNRQIPNALYIENAEGSNKVMPFMRAIFGINTTTILNQVKGSRDVDSVEKPKTAEELEAEAKVKKK